MSKITGDIEIKLSGEAHTLRCCHMAMAEIEARSEKGIIKLANAFIVGDVSSQDIAAVVYGGVCGAINPKSVKDMPWSFENCHREVFDHGVFNLHAQCMIFITALVKGSSEEEEVEKNPSSGDSSESRAATAESKGISQKEKTDSHGVK